MLSSNSNQSSIIGAIALILFSLTILNIDVSTSQPFKYYATIGHNQTTSDDFPFATFNGTQEWTKGSIANYSSRLKNILGNSSYTHDNDLVDLNLTSFALHLMEQRYKSYIRGKIDKSRPYIVELLKESQVSISCSNALNAWMEKLSEMELWAAIMWNSWGDFPPSGLFEGSFTDLGSYKGCFSIRDNDLIGESMYCTLDFQPLVPTRPRFHSIFKRILEVDPVSGQLNSGDFNMNPKIMRSKVASHEYKSYKFNRKELESQNVIANKEISSTAGLNLKSGTIKEMAKIAQFFYYMKFRLGSCWPSRCSYQDIQNISQTAGTRAILQATKPNCITKSERNSFKINTYQWFSIIILGTLAMITLIASCLDAIRNLLILFQFEELVHKIPTIVENFLEICSIQRNGKRLLSTDQSKMTATTKSNGNKIQPQPKQITCLHGLRFLSMIWIIYGHTVLNTDYQSFTHAFKTINTDLVSFFIVPTLNTNFSVDTFFLISGLLSVYIILSLGLKFDGLLYTIARYIRLTPQLVIVMLMFFLLPLMGDGPLFKRGTEIHAERCYKNFWLNLLYLQSYVNRRELCIIPSWWLSVEMTFHIISLPVIYLLIKIPKFGLALNYAIAALLTTIGSYIHYTNGFAIQYLPSIPQRYEVELEQTQWFFHRPYPHAASYFIGLALGYVLANRCITKLSRTQLYLGWGACYFSSAISLSGIYNWNLGSPYTQLEATLYYNACQILWPMSIGWIILACSLGYGGVVNAILSAKLFIPLGRITYMTYLSHIIIIYYFAASPQHTMEPSSLNLTVLCVTNIILSLSFGMILSLIYEAPMLSMQRELLRRKYNRVETTIISPADTNGLSNQLIVKVETTQPPKSNRLRYSYRTTLISKEGDKN